MDIYCGNCGQKNDPSAKFCESCGNPLSPIQPPIPDKPMQNVSSNVSINTGQSKKKQSQSSTTYILIGGIALIVIIVFVIAAIILVKNRVPVSALNNQSTLIPAITNSATIQQPTNDQCSIVWQRFMQSYSQNFDLVSGNWRGRFGCANGLSCTNETWIAQEKSNGCDISYQLEVNGVEKTVGMFYIDLNTDKISASDDPNNFGVPEESIEWVANSTNSQSFLNTVMPPSTLATIEAITPQNFLKTVIPLSMLSTIEAITTPTPGPVSQVTSQSSTNQPQGTVEASSKTTQTITQTPEEISESSSSGPTGKIVYTCEVEKDNTVFDQICIINPDGSGQSQLTNVEGSAIYPSLSPNGRSIIFSSNMNGHHDIYEMDTSGNGITELTNGLSEALSPRISPDGEKIVFTNKGITKATALFMMNADGSNIKEIFNENTFDVLRPAWSPDGSQILFFNSADSQLYIYSVKNGDTKRITDISGITGGASWSPDGSKIAVSQGATGDRQIIILDTKGNLIDQITQDGDNITPNFSTDGNWIGFLSYPPNATSSKSGNLAIIRIDGSDKRLLTHNNLLDWLPYWGP